MDHKLLIILNKADDFARAYGSLCWNLSKVIPRKDLPRIYTMCLPVAEVTTNTKAIPVQLQDLHTARDEVVAEVRKAPQRRLDNCSTQLQDAVRAATLHARADCARHSSTVEYLVLAPSHVANWHGRRGQLFGGPLVHVRPCECRYVTGVIVATTVLATGGLAWYQSLQLAEWNGSNKPIRRRSSLSPVPARTVGPFKRATSTWHRCGSASAIT
jgi:hypothetical protein